MIPPRPYQSELIVAIRNAWAAGHNNVLAVQATRTGKTVVFSDILSEETEPCIAIAHRQELISQMSLTLARCKVMHRIVAPPKLIRRIVHLHTVETGSSWYDPRANVATASVNTLVRRTKELETWLPRVKLWVTDECFPAGTLIDGIPIEKLKVGDMVTAYDEKTGNFAKKKITRLFKNPAPNNMVRLQAGHHVIYCTHGHPILTNEGWMNAGKITKRHKVYVVQYTDRKHDGISTILLEKNWANFLRTFLRICASKCKSKTSKTRENHHKLYNLWKACDSIKTFRKETIQRHGASLLFPSMCECLSQSDIVRNNGENQSKICFETHERKQPYASRRDQSEDVINFENYRSPTKNKRGEREASHVCRINTYNFIWSSWVRITNHCEHWLSQGRIWLSASLQNRLWKCRYKIRDRSGRAKSSFIGTTSTRCQERRSFNWVRVDDVEIYQRGDSSKSIGSCRDDYVYNIEVEDFHTYIANGVVVHNCHHLLRENLWGKAVTMFQNARGLGVTATPLRADGKGLGRHADGVFDTMTIGLQMGEAIRDGWLLDYKIFVPPGDFERPSTEGIGSTGDFKPAAVKASIRKSHIIGDVVTHYQRIVPGKQAVVFAPDVETASDFAVQFNQAGIPAEVVSAKTPDFVRNEIMQRYRRRELLVLVNVDLFGEGTDLPDLEVVIMARPTESFGLYAQQFNRASTIALPNGVPDTREARLAAIAGSNKPHAIIIDHVGNVVRHGLPDAPREWTLDARERRSRNKPDDAVPLRACLNITCMQVYERFLPACPYCGYKPEPASRSAPEFVDGDLTELDEATLAAMRGEVARVDMTPDEYRSELAAKHCPTIGQHAHVKRHIERQDAQQALRTSISWWAGYHRAAGRSDAESYRRFYHSFGIDALSACALGAADALALADRVNLALTEIK